MSRLDRFLGKCEFVKGASCEHIGCEAHQEKILKKVLGIISEKELMSSDGITMLKGCTTEPGIHGRNLEPFISRATNSKGDQEEARNYVREALLAMDMKNCAKDRKEKAINEHVEFLAQKCRKLSNKRYIGK